MKLNTMVSDVGVWQGALQMRLQRTQIPGNKLLSAPPTLWSTANPKYWSISQPKMHWSSEMHLYGCFRHYQITRKSIPMSLLQKKQSTILRTQFLFKLSQNAMHFNMKNMISRMKTLDILFMCSGGWRGGGAFPCVRDQGWVDWVG